MATAQYNDISYGNVFVDALASGNRFVPSGTDGVNPVITYFFEGTQWSTNGARDAFILALDGWAHVANITFREVTSSIGATWTETLYSDASSNTLGAHYYPNNQGLGGEFNIASGYFQYNMLGGVGYVTFLHEIGHGLGLDHPFETSDFPGVTINDSTDQGDNNFANGFYTVMSYTDDPWFAVAPGYNYGYVSGPMAFDIATIQAIYGANMSVATGNNVYTLPTGNAEGTFWTCIWDAGGTDTISGAANGAGVTIDLRAATLQNVEGGGGRASWQSGTLGGAIIYGGFTIANNVVIENAVGSAYGDDLTGNAYANQITGGAGDDTIYALEGNDIIIGGAGRDTLSGGAGADTFIYASLSDATTGGTLEQITDFEVGTDKIDFTALSLTNVTISLSGTNYVVTGATQTGTISVSVVANGTVTTADLLGAPSNFNVINGTAAANILTGTAGDDEINGLGGDDQLSGREGNDRLFGGDGNDTLAGEGGDDRIDGGSGADIALYNYAASGVTIDLTVTAAQATGGAGTDTLVNVENLFGSGFDDILRGNAAANVLYGGAANDQLSGREGDDVLFGGDGDDILGGDAGNDRMDGGNGADIALYNAATSAVNVDLTIGYAQDTGGAGMDTLLNIENLFGSNYDDVLRGTAAGNVMYGGAGNDQLAGREGDDTLFGGDGNDIVGGDTGNDRMDGGAGTDLALYNASTGAVTVDLGIGYAQNTGGAGTDTLLNIENLFGSNYSDVLRGSASDNVIYGGTGNDQIYGREGHDTLFGGDGNDTLVGDAGNDRMEGGDGADIALYNSAAAAVSVDLSITKAQNTGGAGSDILVAIENLFGSVYSDSLKGDNGANVVYGNGGNDQIFGRGGNDVLFGDAGNDVIFGGEGADRMTGGAGADTFVWLNTAEFSVPASLADHIVDFNQGEGDRINLGSLDAKTTTGAVNDAFTFIGSGAFTSSAGQLRSYVESGVTWVEGDTNGDGVADFWIRLTGSHTLQAGDFIL